MQHVFKRISVIGLGYIGLPTAAVLANRGVDVVGVDVDPHKVEVINAGEIPIEEPDLDVMVHGAVSSGHLRATLQAEPAEAFLVAVPTPFKGDYEPDLSYIMAAAEQMAPVLEKGNLVVLESTSPVGATEQMCARMAELRPDLRFPQNHEEESDIHVAYCPERVLPGRVLIELVDNDRVIGGMTTESTRRAIDLYKIFVQAECVPTDARTAEMTKLVENSFRDVNIAFANELSVICDKFGINVWELIPLANRHPRVDILQPGPGVGGHCIAIDPWFIVHGAGSKARIIRAAREINDGKPDFVVNQVKAHVEELGGQATVACMGLAFKADIDDLRESPAVTITDRVADLQGARVLAVEPYVEALPNALAQRNDIELVDTQRALNEADVIVILVDHKEFKALDRSQIKDKPVVDTRGIWSL